jgi:anti-sigma28 factor (negative regulator of flagellin synthesis)
MQVHGVNGVRQTPALQTATRETQPAAPRDTIAVSEAARCAGPLQQEVRDLPPVRPDRVEQARAKLQAGELADARAIARSILATTESWS